MSIITEQIKRLRDAANRFDAEGAEPSDGDLMREAADTIEQLAAKVRAENNKSQPCKDAISRQAAVDFLETHKETYEDIKIKMGFKASASLINNRNNLPSVNPQPNKEDIHREREQAYMRGFEAGRKSEWAAWAGIEPQERSE